MDSISPGLRVIDAAHGRVSTTYSGSALPVVPAPRIRTVMASPGCGAVGLCTPEALPEEVYLPAKPASVEYLQLTKTAMAGDDALLLYAVAYDHYFFQQFGWLS